MAIRLLDCRVRGDHPGILGLFVVLDDHGGAVEADLIDKGLRLRWIGKEDFSLRDLLTVIEHLPRESALVRKLNPDAWMWSHTDFLLALLYDKQAEHNWMISRDGAKGVRRPKPLPRPGIEDDSETKKYTGRAIPIDEMRQKVEHLYAVPDDAEPVRGKLSAEQVTAIRSLARAGNLTNADLAASYEVSVSTIGRIVRRETWADLDDVTA